MTVREIADLAGVSIGTVDRVLHNRNRVSAETRARIESIIEQSGFTPNLIAQHLKRNKPYRFCALMPRREQDAGYWGQVLAGIERAAGEIEGLGVATEVVEFDRYDFPGFERIAASLCARKPDGLLFAPIMPKRTRGFVERFCAENLPLVFVDSEMPDTAPLSAIVQDPFRGGYLAGRLFHLFAGEVAKPAAVLDAHGEDYHITKRRDGFLRYAEEHGFPVILQEYDDYDEGTEISVAEIARFLERQPDLSGLFITNCMAYRAAEAVIDRRNRERTFILVGYDLIPDNQRLLHAGRIDAIISQRPEEQGREALLTLFRAVALGQKVKPRQEVPLDVYIRENLF